MKILGIVALIAFSTTALGQIYEWVDEKGVKQFTQYPPPPNIKQVQQRRPGSNVVETSGPSYGMQQAVKNFPVTLYITDCGDACKEARAHLAKRGVPYTEKDAQKPAEFEALKKLSGGTEVPYLVVGQLRSIKGYLASEWDSALTAAGYPSTAVPGSKPATKPPAGTPAPGK